MCTLQQQSILHQLCTEILNATVLKIMLWINQSWSKGSMLTLNAANFASKLYSNTEYVSLYPRQYFEHTRAEQWAVIGQRLSLNGGPGQQLILHQYWKYWRARADGSNDTDLLHQNTVLHYIALHKYTNTQIHKYIKTNTATHPMN